MTDIQEGPFQNIQRVSFPGDSDPGDWIDGEDMCGEDPCGENYYTIRSPGVENLGVGFRTCVCEADPAFSGGQDIHAIRFTLPLTPTPAPWPDCAIGCMSGAKISQHWPDKPAGWDSGTPAAIYTPPIPYCTTPLHVVGGIVGGVYQVTFNYLVTCYDNIYENCC